MVDILRKTAWTRYLILSNTYQWFVQKIWYPDLLAQYIQKTLHKIHFLFKIQFMSIYY